LFCSDILQFVRSISWRQEPRFKGDTAYTKSCLEMCIKLFSPVIRILKETDIKTYVICFDPYGRSRKEKAHTHKARRVKKVDPYKPTRVFLPFGQRHYFQDDAPIPGDINLVFSTPDAKKDLYDYLTSYLISDRFKQQIPNGKRVILSGGLIVTQNNNNNNNNNNSSSSSSSSSSNQPVNYSNYTNVYAQEITSKYHKSLEWISPAFISEGDLDVWRMAHLFKDDGDVVIESGDGDILLIGLMQMRNIYHQTPNRRVFFKTRRSAGVEKYPQAYYDNHAEKYKIFKETLEKTGDSHKAYRASGGITKEKPAGKPRIKWQVKYIDIKRLWAMMWKQAIELQKNLGIEISCPVEEWVCLVCISSSKHDYFNRKTIYMRVGEDTALLTYLHHKHQLGKIVEVFHRKGKPQHHHVYQINIEALDKLSQYGFIEQCKKRNKRDSNVNKKLSDSKYDEKVTKKGIEQHKKNMKKEEELYQNSLRIGASQLSWILQYYGNGVFQDLTIVDGTAVDQTTKLSLYGYTNDDFATKVTEQPSEFRQCG
jgi:hypothetical protein